jgi:hypothetical protein
VTVVHGEDQAHLYATSDGAETNKWDLANAGFSSGGPLWLEDGESVQLAYIDQDLMTAPITGIKPSFSADGGSMALYSNGQISRTIRKGRRTQTLEGSHGWGAIFP